MMVMEINWLGQACFRIKGKNATVVIDPFDPEAIGLKLPKDLAADAVLQSHEHKDHSNLAAVAGDPIQVTGPGEYEVKGISIVGIPTFHDKSLGSERGMNTVYNITIDGINIVHLGDLGHTLSEEQVQLIDLTDILLIPVGGVYTIDAKDATQVVAQLEPKVIIPMHYGDIPGLKFELAPVSDFLKELGKDVAEPVNKYVITKDKLPEEPQVVVFQKS